MDPLLAYLSARRGMRKQALDLKRLGETYTEYRAQQSKEPNLGKLEGASGVNKNMPFIKDIYTRAEKGESPEQLRGYVGEKLRAEGLFGSQARADELQKTVDFLRENPDVAKNYGMGGGLLDSFRFAGVTGGMKDISAQTQQAREQAVGGSGMLKMLDWMNQNKNWLIPVGLGVGALGALGAGAMFMGRNRGSSGSATGAAVPGSWQVGDQWAGQ